MTKLRTKEKPFPWYCIKCGAEEVYPSKLRYTTEVKHDGRLHRLVIDDLTVPVCRKCGEKVFTDSVDEQISQTLRSQLRLLSPEQILRGIRDLGLSQKEAAARLRVAEATLSRWVSGSVIQSRAMDNLLRVYFAFPEVRRALTGESQDADLGVPSRTA
jgi:putative zinc finger/helix-turn-helix YgiT family protein